MSTTILSAWPRDAQTYKWLAFPVINSSVNRWSCDWLPGASVLGLSVGLAVIHDNVSAIEELVQRGADVNGYDLNGNTALVRAGYSLKRACLHKQVYWS